MVDNAFKFLHENDNPTDQIKIIVSHLGAYTLNDNEETIYFSKQLEIFLDTHPHFKYVLGGHSHSFRIF